MTAALALVDQFGTAVGPSGSAAAPDAIFVQNREPPAAWQALLNQVMPHREGGRDHRIVWEPGEVHEPIQRWFIWQGLPAELTQRLILQDNPLVMGLNEEHPRANARWDATMGCFRKPDGTLAKTDKLTWELYKITGQKWTRFWVIQGDRGGHRYNLSATEKQLLFSRSRGKIKDVPLAGDLPYADFDSRVLTHLERIESAAMARKICKYADQQRQVYDLEEQREIEEARTYLFDWLGDQMGAVYDEFRPFYKEQLRKIKANHTKVGQKPEHTDGDIVRDRFIHDT